MSDEPRPEDLVVVQGRRIELSESAGKAADQVAEVFRVHAAGASPVPPDLSRLTPLYRRKLREAAIELALAIEPVSRTLIGAAAEKAPKRTARVAVKEEPDA